MLAATWAFIQGIWKLVIPTDPAGFWAFALVVVAYRGLRSLRLSKTDMVTRAKRDARLCAVERCEEMAQKLIPESFDIWTEAQKLKVPALLGSIDEATFASDAASVTKATDWVTRLSPELRNRSVDVVNNIEGWAVYFGSAELADQAIAFEPCAAVFCAMVVQHYAILVWLRSDSTSGKFPNTVKLFKIWKERLEADKRGLEQKDLLRKLRSLPASAPKPFPKAIGTELDE